MKWGFGPSQDVQGPGFRDADFGLTGLSDRLLYSLSWKGVFRCAPGLNRHVVGNARVLQERRKRIHLGPESYGRRREASAEA